MDLKRELEAIELTLAELEEQRVEIINRLDAAAASQSTARTGFWMEAMRWPRVGATTAKGPEAG